ncbi:IS3 family transposase [Jeotgalibaca sp. YN-L-12]|nr:IS3 family transposase [Jeotgalibaca caeni]MDE1550047.1 IS3 family transposase [Jeotgalibaca caeni]
MQQLHTEKGYPVKVMCKILRVTRSAYYRWLKQPQSPREIHNTQIAEVAKQIHEEHDDMGHRRIRDELAYSHGIFISDTRALRICRSRQIQSRIKHRANSITKAGYHPYHIAENRLNRDFRADAPNEKWLTDVTEFKYYEGTKIKKIYLSAILDLYDRRIVAYEISDRNDLSLVFQTFDAATNKEPDAHPLFHSDRGFQYTHKQFYKRLEKAGMCQSMSRVGRCIDNGPMEGFWGIIKREKYYRRTFTSCSSLVAMIHSYMEYYNNKRIQRKLHIMTPMAFHHNYYNAA